MQPHQQRVIDEQKELDERIGKLHIFLDGDVFKNLDDAEKDRLTRQFDCMVEYSDILSERIGAFR